MPFHSQQKNHKKHRTVQKGGAHAPPSIMAQIRLIDESVKNNSRTFTSKETSLFPPSFLFSFLTRNFSYLCSAYKLVYFNGFIYT